MYKLKQLLPAILFVIALTGLFACKKSKTTTPSGTGKAFYCKLDGTAFEPGTGRYYSVSTGGIQIVGDNSATTLEIRLSSDAVGTYALAGNTTANFGSVYYTASGERVSTEGEAKITKSDGTKISGTFHYKATGPAGTVEVTDGEFNDIMKK